MNEDQCKYPEPCDPDHCESGGKDCETSVTIPPLPNPTEHPESRCHTDGEYHTNEVGSYARNFLHWSCTFGPKAYNFVRDKDNMPSGTKCTANHR